MNYFVANELIVTSSDCNDAVATINPAAAEICDGIDNNCDGMTDEGTLTTYYQDLDGDGFGNPAATQMACSQPAGYVANADDCDDADALEKPGQVWYKDTDGDDYSDGTTLTQCLHPANYYVESELIATNGDCNEAVATINPAASEICDGLDNNCDGMTDEGALTTYYQDLDGDGFGNPAATQMACSQPTGYVANDADCDDADALEKPGQVWYKDADGDDYSDGTTLTQCLRPTNYFAENELIATSGDCNDAVATISPAALETCDGIDNNCDGMTDEGALTTYYQDLDGDGFGDPVATQMACSQPTGYVANDADCDDADALEKPGQVWYVDADNDGYSTGIYLIQCLRPAGFKVAAELTAHIGDCNDSPSTGGMTNPAASETCDGMDNNCNGQTDEGVKTEYFADADGDGFGDPNNMITECGQPTGYVANSDDCDDTDDEVNPAQEEVCDDKDNDCNGVVDDIGGSTAGSWTSGDVGGSAGNANFPPCNAAPNDIFTINATGFSTSSSDKLHAVYQTLCGNGEIIARILNVENGGWAGIMLRETLDPGSKKVSLKTQLTPSIRREIRSVTNGAVSMLNFNRPQHVWLRLVRVGSNFSGFTSIDGANWSFAFTANVSMTGCIYVGLFAESINNSVTTTATFDNVSILGSQSNLVMDISKPTPVLKQQTPEVDVYPNPATRVLNLDLSAYPNPVGAVLIFDAYGKIVQQYRLDGSPVFRMDITAVDGVYFLSVAVEGYEPVAKRVVIAH